MVKSIYAFRNISEVAEELNLPQHVLRFWETKFTSIKPMKRGGGRRYYRPEDIGNLRRIQSLLYDDGYTIKGVQKLFREGGKADMQEVLPSAGKKRPSKVVNNTILKLQLLLNELEEMRNYIRNYKE
jgi:DNA-binding transcriptional MerR regulator